MELNFFDCPNKENIDPLNGKVSGLKKKTSKRYPLADITAKTLGSSKDSGR